jgi:hypothetical protein
MKASSSGIPVRTLSERTDPKVQHSTKKFFESGRIKKKKSTRILGD